MREAASKFGNLVICTATIANLVLASPISSLSSKNFEVPLANSPKTIWVDDDFVDDPPNHKWDTIQEGIDDAISGDTVYVFNGTYREAVSIRKTIKLIGEDPASTIIDGNRTPEIMGIGADGVQVSGFSLINGNPDRYTRGIQIRSSYNLISGNIIDTGSDWGVFVSEEFPGEEPEGNTITQNVIVDVEWGVHLFRAHGNIVSENHLTNDSSGIVLIDSNGNLISSNTIVSRNEFGVYLCESRDNRIADNTINSSLNGIGIDLSQANWITGNDIVESLYGIGMGESQANWITGNDIIASQIAIGIFESEDITVNGNMMIGGGVGLYGDVIEYWNTHSIDASNLLNGKPVYYLKNAHGGTIPLDAGQVILAGSHYVTIARLNISNNISHRFKGIQLGFSSTNKISNNTLSGDFYAITLENSTGNQIYHNNFDWITVRDNNPEKNDWHHPILLEGNYWSSYRGVDDGSGLGKHSIAGDGIGDTLIPHPWTDFDFYPFTEPGGWEIPTNRAPIADANGPYIGDEGSPIPLDGNGSYDPDGDFLQYRWDLNNDGIWDTGWSSSPYLEHTWEDDHAGEVALQVSDGEFTDTDTADITVNNVAPTVELEVLPIEVNVLLRMAGEKWHDVTTELYEDGVLVAKESLIRYPGSPNDQMLNLTHLDLDTSKNYSAIVRYTPEDDPINGQLNGASPCWIILRFDDGEELWLHHTFNVQHEEAYIWEVDMTQAMLMHGITLKTTAYNPGADDLTFHWDFGDGTKATSFYPNPNGTYPVIITEMCTHIFPGSGTYVVTVTVEDDDGGIGTASFTIHIP